MFYTLNMDKGNESGLRINKLWIKNYKAIDELEIEFPKPELEGDSDVFVLGSQNGVGKTSVLECCGLVFLALNWGEKIINHFFPLLYISRVRTGAAQAEISAYLGKSGHEFKVTVTISAELKDGYFTYVITAADEDKLKDFSSSRQARLKSKTLVDDFKNDLNSLLGQSQNPLLLPGYLYFHSYRKVPEGGISLNQIINSEKSDQEESVLEASTFKKDVIRLLISKSGLVDNINEEEVSSHLDKLNDLVKEFACGRIEKLKNAPDNAYHLLFTEINSGLRYIFDHLSSGQKEMISTLFLISRATSTAPGIILIDEPELHLNAGWHRSIVNCLHKINLHNQYILATHSDIVFDSVDAKHRILLENG